MTTIPPEYTWIDPHRSEFVASIRSAQGNADSYHAGHEGRGYRCAPV